MGHVILKTRSLGQSLEKPCVLSRRHSFDPILCIVIKSRPEFKLGHVGSKTRSLGQFLEKPCVLSRRHSFDPVFMKLCQNDFLTLNKRLSRRAMLSDDSSCFFLSLYFMLTLKICVGVFSGIFKARMLKLCIHMDNELLYYGIDNRTPCSYSFFYFSIFIQLSLFLYLDCLEFVIQFSLQLIYCSLYIAVLY